MIKFVRKPLEAEAVNIGQLKQNTVQLEWVERLINGNLLQLTKTGAIFNPPTGIEVENDDGYIVRDADMQVALWTRASFNETFQSTPLTPRAIETIKVGSQYLIPVFEIKDGHIEQTKDILSFAKGSIADATIYRQRGFFDVTLLEVVKQYLTDVNVGELATRETSTAITKIDEALLWISKRKQDREARGVLSTYKK